MKRFFTQEQMVKQLQTHIFSVYGTQAKAAAAWNMSQANVSMICRGNRPPPDSVLKEMCLKEKKTVIYEYYEED